MHSLELAITRKIQLSLLCTLCSLPSQTRNIISHSPRKITKNPPKKKAKPLQKTVSPLIFQKVGVKIPPQAL